jgi:hypothetical protein
MYQFGVSHFTNSTPLSGFSKNRPALSFFSILFHILSVGYFVVQIFLNHKVQTTTMQEIWANLSTVFEIFKVEHCWHLQRFQRTIFRLSAHVERNILDLYESGRGNFDSTSL